MKYIPKKDHLEPDDFKKWKADNSRQITALCSRGATANQVWSLLPSSLPSIQEEGVHYYSRKQLEEDLLHHQGGICTYCNRLLSSEPLVKGDKDLDRKLKRIDHLDPKSQDPFNNTFDYHNLVVSCHGGQRNPKPRKLFCDAAKNERPIDLKPTEAVCETEIYFTLDGQIVGTTPRANQTINVLGLDYFTDARSAVIRGLLFIESPDPERSFLTNEMLDRADAQKLLKKIAQPGQDGKYIEDFCSAIISVIRQQYGL